MGIRHPIFAFGNPNKDYVKAGLIELITQRAAGSFGILCPCTKRSLLLSVVPEGDSGGWGKVSLFFFPLNSK